MQATKRSRELLISAALLLGPMGCTIEVYYQEPASAACGNGVLELGEPCDDGNTSNNDACLGTCVLASCGDAFVHLGFEQCDDGNTTSGDGCSSTCALEACGDGTVDVGEECDTGGTSATCDPDCTFAQCGDAVWNPSAGEQCDTVVDSATCNAAICTLAQCGDGFYNPAAGEACDDGNIINGDGCESDCTLTP